MFGAQACSADDNALTTGADTSTTTPTTSATTAPSSVASTATTTAAETTTTTAAGAETTIAQAAVGQMAIDFTYTEGRGGKPLNPYISVWIENTDGEALRTLELWFQQDDKGPRWLPDLKRWFRIDESRISAGGDDLVDVISSATRQPGGYSVVWDGNDDRGGAVDDETVFVCIEAVRERGPYSLIREQIARTDRVKTQLPDEGELSNASVNTDV